jgi:exodeoxyribonuclease V alpha subunit
MLNPQSTYQLIVSPVVSEKYGKSYELHDIQESVKAKAADGERAFMMVLCSERQTNLLYKAFNNPLKMIQSRNVEALAAIKGIGPKTVDSIFKRYDKNEKYAHAIIELSAYGLTAKTIIKIVDACKTSTGAIHTVKKYPYSLIELVDGISFRKADAIARRSGVSEKSVERIKAFIQFYLNEQIQESHSYVYADTLLQAMDAELCLNNILEHYEDKDGNKSGTNISVAIDKLKDAGELGIIEDESCNSRLRHVYLKWIYDLESDVADDLRRIQANKFCIRLDDQWMERVHQVEEEQGFTFTPEQLEGIKLALDEQVVFITGGAGSGKTSLLNGILAALGCYEGKVKFAQCSLSGKAAARMTEVTHHEGMTIHRLLEFGFGEPKRNRLNPLSQDLIVVDEISLIGGSIFSKLLAAIPNGAKLIMLGDMGQLESIGCMNLAADLYHSPTIPTVELTKIHRQAAMSGIITTAREIRAGNVFFGSGHEGTTIYGELQDMELFLRDERDTIFDDVMDSFNEWYYSDLVQRNIMDIQVLCPVKSRGAACVAKFNEAIQARVNPADPEKEELTVDTRAFRVGDKVMCISNHYDVLSALGRTDDLWPYGKTDIFNGWVGIITTIGLLQEGFDDDDDDEGGIHIGVYFPLVDQTVYVDKKLFLQAFQLGYASTIHKYQGSSVKCVIGVIDYTTPPNMLTKELVYTLVTRAEKYCVLIAQTGALRQAIRTSGVRDKLTFLPMLLNHSEKSEQK